MAWFDHSGQKQLHPVKFDDVTPRHRRQPSWLVKGRTPSSPMVPVTLPPPPAIPGELLVDSPRIEEVDITTGKIASKHETARDPAARIPNEQSRPSMTPAELESLVAERAAKQATDQAAEQILQEAQAAILQAVQALASAHTELSDKLCARTVELAILVARRVVGRELLTQPDIVTDLVREGLEVLNVRDRVRVHLGQQFAVVKDELVAHFATAGTMMDVNLDLTLPPYGCVVETEVGSVDESIESRLATLLDALAEGGEG